jgi:hypothetical protein
VAAEAADAGVGGIANAASTALPPARKICSPAAAACAVLAVTAPFTFFMPDRRLAVPGNIHQRCHVSRADTACLHSFV